MNGADRQAGPAQADQPAPRSPHPQITVVIVDDHLLVADAIAAVLGDTDDITVLDIAGTCAAGLAAVGRHRPAVLLLDQRLPDELGTLVLPEMLAASPGTKVLLVTASDSDEVLTNAIEAGAVGVVTKGKRAFSLVAAVRAAANDEPVITPDDLRRLMPRLGQRGRRVNATLTSREREVLDMLVAGKGTGELARALFVAPATARNHIQAIMTNSGRIRASRRSPSPTAGRTGPTRTESGSRAGNLRHDPHMDAEDSRVAYLGLTAISLNDLEGVGADLQGALGGRIPADDPDLVRFQERRVPGVTGWRVISDGEQPDWPGGSALKLAAPVEGGWQIATFIPQQDGSWGAMHEPGPFEPQDRLHETGDD